MENQVDNRTQTGMDTEVQAGTWHSELKPSKAV